MSQANVEIVQSIYAAFARGDGAAVLASMDPAIVWNEAENFPYADRNPYVGHAAIASGIFFRLATEWDHFQALPSEFLDAGEDGQARLLLGQLPAGVSLGRPEAHLHAGGRGIDQEQRRVSGKKSAETRHGGAQTTPRVVAVQARKIFARWRQLRGGVSPFFE